MRNVFPLYTTDANALLRLHGVLRKPPMQRTRSVMAPRRGARIAWRDAGLLHTPYTDTSGRVGCVQQALLP